MEKQKYYLTSSLPYASGKQHIGNMYEMVVADSLARYKKTQGYDVFFQTGTDEHGEKIELKAKAEGITPKQFTDRTSSTFKALQENLNVKYDNFIRTTDEHHKKQVQKIFDKLVAQGDIYKGNYEGMYCTPCESFWTSSQLVDGKCPDCGRDCQPKKEEAYFFKMSNYADKLLKHIEENPDFVTPRSTAQEMINNFIKPGLRDLCVSRTTINWGIPVNSDPKHVVYVWLDALTNYITGLGYDLDGNNAENFKKYWPCDVHIVGKDIARFHIIYWPIFVMALGLPLPKKIFSHPWLLQDGLKMSKSKGNIIYSDDLVNVLGVDAVRYYLLAEMPFDNDGNITWESIINKTNSDLVNVYGNLVSRTISMANKYFDGVLENKNVCEPVDDELKNIIASAYKKLNGRIEEFRFADAMGEIFAIFRRANKYVDETCPWVLAKDEGKKDRLSTVLYNLAQAIVAGTSLLAPFLPDACEKILKQMNCNAVEFENIEKLDLIPNGTKVTSKHEFLFNRLDNDEIMNKVLAMYEERKAKEEKVEKVEEIKTVEQISIDDFAKIQLKVALVTACEKVEKSDKLLKLTLKLGNETRTVVSGIAKAYSPEEMVGKRVVLLANLKPAKLRGIMSEGMILCAENEEGKLALLTPDKDIEDGSCIF